TPQEGRSGTRLVEEPRSDWRRAVAVVSERRVAEGRALYTERSPAELYRGARSSERERYARQASRLGAKRPSTNPGPSYRMAHASLLTLIVHSMCACVSPGTPPRPTGNLRSCSRRRSDLLLRPAPAGGGPESGGRLPWWRAG